MTEITAIQLAIEYHYHIETIEDLEVKVKYSNKAKAIRDLRDAAIMSMDDVAANRYQEMLDAELSKCKAKAKQ